MYTTIENTILKFAIETFNFKKKNDYKLRNIKLVNLRS